MGMSLIKETILNEEVWVFNLKELRGAALDQSDQHLVAVEEMVESYRRLHGLRAIRHRRTFMVPVRQSNQFANRADCGMVYVYIHTSEKPVTLHLQQRIDLDLITQPKTSLQLNRGDTVVCRRKPGDSMVIQQDSDVAPPKEVAFLGAFHDYVFVWDQPVR